MQEYISKDELKKEIRALKEKHNAVIVAHNYQVDDVQDIADVVGDSFALSKYCAGVDVKTIVFCGVHFMAESAKILSPQKTVLLPEIDAGCPMADMVTVDKLIEAKKQNPDAKVVCYINSSAEVKAESDVCCTSSNAVEIVSKLDADKILFVPDQNLGRYVSGIVKNKKIILWDGYCITHHRISKQEAEKALAAHPDALLLVHPECKAEVLDLAHFVGSTKQIIDYAKMSDCKKFLIGTEMGVLHSLKKYNPDKQFYSLSNALICPNMKKTSLESVYRALKDMRYNITLDEDIRLRAKKALDRMLEV